MDLLIKLLLTLIYLFILPVRGVRTLRRRDTLRLQQPTNASSYWVMRDQEPNPQSYFSEASVVEGHPLRLGKGFTDYGAARWFTPVLLLFSHLCAKHQTMAEGKYSFRTDRAEGIPDEVYTLW